MDTESRDPGLLRRIEELAARAAEEEQGPPEGPVLAAALTGLRAELGGLRAEIGTLRADLTAIRSGVESSTGRLSGAITAARSETEDLGRRQDDLRSVMQSLVDAVSDVRGTLPELRTALGDQPDVGDAVQAGVARLDAALDTKLETLAGDLRRTLSAGMTQVTAGTRAAETVSAEARTAMEGRLAALEDTIDGLAERLEALTRDSIGAATERIMQVERKLDEIVGTSLADTVEAQGRWAEEIRAALSDVGAVVDRNLASLGDSLTDALRTSREAEASHIDAVLAQMSTAFDGAVTELEQRIAVARDSSAASTAELHGFVEGFQNALTQRLEEVRSQLDSGFADARSALVEELTPTIEALEQANSATGRVVESELNSLRSDLADALEEVRDRIATQLNSSSASVTGAIDDQRASFDEVVRGLRSDVLDRVEESTATVSTGLDELRGGVESAARSGQETATRVDDFATTLDELADVVATMNEDWDRRTSAAIDHVSAAGHAAVSEFRSEIRQLVGDLRHAVDQSNASLNGTGDVVMAATSRLVTAGEALLGYLARRDQLLEAERDRVLHEVLDEFAQGLSSRERKSLSGKVGAAVERRRDSRDATRYRAQTAGAPAVEIPDVPDDLSELTKPLKIEAGAGARAAASARKSAAAKKAPGKKTAAKKTAAKKTAAKKTTAKKTAAKKAAAKKTTAGAPPAAETGPAKKEPAAKKAAPAKKLSPPVATKTAGPANKSAPAPAKSAAPAKVAPAKAAPAKSTAPVKATAAPSAPPPPAPVPENADEADSPFIRVAPPTPLPEGETEA